jgi:transposase
LNSLIKLGPFISAYLDPYHELTIRLKQKDRRTKTVLGTDKLDVVADRGYYKSDEILACHKTGITVTLPKPQTSNNKAKGLFVKPDFVYLADRDVYRSLGGQYLSWRFKNQERGLMLRRYWSSDCQSCAIKDKCTIGKERRVTRWEHEEVLEEVQQRLDEHPEKMRQRRETVEHPFGTIKCRMGYTHFQIENVEPCGHRDGAARARL